MYRESARHPPRWPEAHRRAPQLRPVRWVLSWHVSALLSASAVGISERPPRLVGGAWLPHVERIARLALTAPITNLPANFLLESTVERLHHKFEYSDVDIGVLLIRGENVVALGEIVSCLVTRETGLCCRSLGRTSYTPSLLAVAVDSLTLQDLIAEDNLPLREIPIEEMRQKLADIEVS